MGVCEWGKFCLVELVLVFAEFRSVETVWCPDVIFTGLCKCVIFVLGICDRCVF